MDAARASEMLINIYETTRRYNPEQSVGFEVVTYYSCSYFERSQNYKNVTFIKKLTPSHISEYVLSLQDMNGRPN